MADDEFTAVETYLRSSQLGELRAEERRRRKFCRTEKSSRSMAHKGFDAWLKSNYEGGQPTAVDLQTAQDDEDCIVAPSPTIYATSPLPVPAEDGNLNDGDANLSPRSLSGY
ncbi:hypothetical protein EMCRGX_G002944 [Ephydatia muelleri]